MSGIPLLDNLTPRDRRALSLGLLVIVPALFFVFGVRPYRSALADAHAVLTTEQDLLARELALIASGPSLPATIDYLQRKAEIAEDRTVRASSEVLAEATVTDELEHTAGVSRVLLQEIRRVELARGEEPPNGLGVVRLSVSGESDLRGVLTFLDGIEASQHLLRVRRFALEPEMERPDDGDDNERTRADPEPTGVVEFEIIVEGYASLVESIGTSPSGT